MKTMEARNLGEADLVRSRPIGIRWTMGDVRARGFEALRLSIWGAWHVFGPEAAYVVCVNGLQAGEARARTGPVPEAVAWLDISHAMPDVLRGPLGRQGPRGSYWKLAPLRLFPDRHEISLDNDCILWDLPLAMRRWLEVPAATAGGLMAEDVRGCYGQFEALCPPEPRNAGIRGLPPGFDLEGALRSALARRQCQTGRPVVFDEEEDLDEQGLQVAALSPHGPVRAVSLDDVTVCSPFHPHLPHLGRCGAHFVGLNARSIDWDYYDRPANAWMAEHWARHLPALRERTGTPVDEMA